MANEPGHPPTVTNTPEFKRNLRHLAKNRRIIAAEETPAGEDVPHADREE
jgi:hypothetical protein